MLNKSTNTMIPPDLAEKLKHLSDGDLEIISQAMQILHPVFAN